MPAILKTTQIQEPSSATVNLALDTSGGVTVGQNLKLSGSSSGTTTIAAAAAASGTVTIPSGTGTAAVQGVSTNIVSGTAQASTSGTSIDFTSIPSWVKRITVMLSGVSTNGTSNILVQLGAGSVDTSSYVSSANNGGTGVTSTAGLLFTQSTVATSVHYGSMIISSLGSNIWVSQGCDVLTAGGLAFFAGGKTLSGTLDRVRITTVNGTDTFDAGTINIMYE